MEHRTVTAFLPVRGTSGSVQVPRPGHSRLDAWGPTPVDFFSPQNTVHLLGAPTWPLTAQNHSRARQLSSFSCMLTARTNLLISSTPTHTHLARSTQEPDHGLRPSYFLLLPASIAPCPEHFQDKALGGLIGTNHAARTHLFSSSHNTQTFSAKSHAFSYYSNVFFPNYPIDWIRAMIYGA